MVSRASTVRVLAIAALALTAYGCGSSRTPEDGGFDPTDGGSEQMDGGSSEADGGADETCDTPGATETLRCGACGTIERFCTAAGRWAYGTCTGEDGECTPGDERTSACGACGTQAERCTDACTWEQEGDCAGQGECAPGTRSRSSEGCGPMETREVTCDEACAFAPSSACIDDSCPTPGALERVACGMCGTAERFCTADRVWSYGPCSGEGVCMPGTSETQACGACGTRTARCTTSCAWDTSSACAGEGECAPGTTSRTRAGCPDGQTRPLTCNASCSFDAGACATTECEPGASQVVSCGRCGRRTRTCSAVGLWEDGTCSDEGECTPGTTSSEGCGLCGTRPRRCNDVCTWELAGACTGEVVCTPPASTCLSPTRLRVFSGGASCSGGNCSFASTEIDCATACSAGRCDDLTLVRGLGGIAGFGESTLGATDDGSSSEIDLLQIAPAGGLDFFGTRQTQLFVNNNGNVTFGAALTTFTPTFPRSSGPPLIAAWFGDVDTRMAPSPANAAFWHVDTAGRRLIVTWNQVGHFPQRHDLRNSFQLVLTDRRDVASGDFDVELRYTECQWTTGDASGGSMGLGGTPARVGFDAANGIDFFELPGSGTAAVLDLCTRSNVAVPGLWRYQFRGGQPR